MSDYSIRYLKRDGTLSLLFLSQCAGGDHAHQLALQMLTDDMAGFEIWQDAACVETWSRPAPIPETRPINVDVAAS
jgi:hypothetical protein